METIGRTLEHHRAAAQFLNLEMLLGICDAQREQHLCVFYGNKFVLGDGLVRAVNGKLIALKTVAEEDSEVAVVDVPHLQQVVLNAPIDVAVGHVADFFSSQVFHLAQLPVPIHLVIVHHVQLTGREKEAGE